MNEILRQELLLFSATRYDVRLAGMIPYDAKRQPAKKNAEHRCGFSLTFSSSTVEVYELKPAMNVRSVYGISTFT